MNLYARRVAIKRAIRRALGSHDNIASIDGSMRGTFGSRQYLVAFANDGPALAATTWAYGRSSCTLHVQPGGEEAAGETIAGIIRNA